MDPLTLSLTLANTTMNFAMKIWDATPAPLQAQGAADWAVFVHNIGSFILSVQAKINALEQKP